MPPPPGVAQFVSDHRKRVMHAMTRIEGDGFYGGERIAPGFNTVKPAFFGGFDRFHRTREIWQRWVCSKPLNHGQRCHESRSTEPLKTLTPLKPPEEGLVDFPKSGQALFGKPGEPQGIFLWVGSFERSKALVHESPVNVLHHCVGSAEPSSGRRVVVAPLIENQHRFVGGPQGVRGRRNRPLTRSLPGKSRYRDSGRNRPSHESDHGQAQSVAAQCE
ncbi:hypothetical protein EV580_6624 [Mycobacterium sp. BK086]|nr:hypothetical protein EV580_6624 [Mycobacterium sp. BK086]